VKERKPMSRPVQFVLVALALLVLGLGGWFGLVRPQGAKLKSIKAEETAEQQRLADYQQRVSAARSAPRIDVADVYRLATAMPGETDMPDLILQLSQLARDTGIRFDSMSPQPLSAVGSYSALPISITLNGNFYNLADFLYRLRALVSVHNGRLDATGRLFEVDNLTVSPSPLTLPYIQPRLMLDAFLYGSGAATASAVASPVPAPAPATTTSGTTTTSTTETTTTTGTTTTPTTTTTPQGSSAAGAP